MTWTRLSDSLNSDPRYLRLSDAAFRLHVSALVWCNQHLTDGLVPELALRTLTLVDPERLVDELVRVGLWAPLDLATDEHSWQIDWTEQEPGDDVRDRRKRNAERQARFRDRRDRHAEGDHSRCDPSRCGAAKPSDTSNALQPESNALRTALRNALPSRPDPTRQGRGSAGVGGVSDDPPPADAAGDATPARVEVRCAHCRRVKGACRARRNLKGHDGHEFEPGEVVDLDDPNLDEPAPVAELVDKLAADLNDDATIEPARDDLAAYGLETKSGARSARGSEAREVRHLDANGYLDRIKRRKVSAS